MYLLCFINLINMNELNHSISESEKSISENIMNRSILKQNGEINAKNGKTTEREFLFNNTMNGVETNQPKAYNKQKSIFIDNPPDNDEVNTIIDTDENEFTVNFPDFNEVDTL